MDKSFHPREYALSAEVPKPEPSRKSRKLVSMSMAVTVGTILDEIAQWSIEDQEMVGEIVRKGSSKESGTTSTPTTWPPWKSGSRARPSRAQ